MSGECYLALSPSRSRRFAILLFRISVVFHRFFVNLHRSLTVSHLSFAASQLRYFASPFRCFAHSFFRIALSNLNTFSFSHSRPSVVWHFRCFLFSHIAVLLFCCFALSHLLVLYFSYHNVFVWCENLKSITNCTYKCIKASMVIQLKKPCAS